MSRKKAHHEPERICAFYSKGPHFVRMLKRLREAYPGETLIAAIPASFPFPAIEPLVDETVRLPEAGSVAELRRYWAIVRRLRRARCSHIVVMFDSPRLNLLARLSGTGRGWYYSVDGRLQVLGQSLPGLLLVPLAQRIRGELAFLRARLGTARRARRGE